MDFVYICRDGKNEELRYSLRSIFRNANVNSVWLVGGKPPWYAGNYVRVLQDSTKYENARRNLQTIMDHDQIPDKFILMNDDFYITRPIDKIPIYHGGSLEKKAAEYKNFKAASQHARILQETVDLLKNNGVRHPLDYSLHIPMTIHKQNFQFAIDIGGAIRSVYGNMNRIGGRQLPVHDVKVHNKSIIYPETYDYINNVYDLPFLSTSDQTFPTVYKQFLRSYSNASPWERVIN